MTSSLKPLNHGPKLLTLEEALAILNDVPEKPAPPRKPLIVDGKNRYAWVDGATYAQAMQKLRDLDADPLTFAETIRARVEDYERLTDDEGNKRTEADRLRLFNKYFDTVTGVAYKADTTLMKLIDRADDFVHIDKDFNKEFLPCDYDALSGVELDTSEGTYNEWLTQGDVLAHPAWNVAVPDYPTLETYTNIVFTQKPGKRMRFWPRTNVTSNELRALVIYDMDISSSAGGGSNLSSDARLLRVTHRASQTRGASEKGDTKHDV